MTKWTIQKLGQIYNGLLLLDKPQYTVDYTNNILVRDPEEILLKLFSKSGPWNVSAQSHAGCQAIGGSLQTESEWLLVNSEYGWVELIWVRFK